MPRQAFGDVGKGLAAADRASREASPGTKDGHMFARVVGPCKGRIVAVIGRDHQKVAFA
jgi:hypothetical protein